MVDEYAINSDSVVKKIKKPTITNGKVTKVFHYRDVVNTTNHYRTKSHYKVRRQQRDK